MFIPVQTAKTPEMALVYGFSITNAVRTSRPDDDQTLIPFPYWHLYFDFDPEFHPNRFSLTDRKNHVNFVTDLFHQRVSSPSADSDKSLYQYGNIDNVLGIYTHSEEEYNVNDDVSNIPLCLDALQLEDNKDSYDDFEWEEVVNEREVLSMFDDTSVSVSVGIEEEAEEEVEFEMETNNLGVAGSKSLIPFSIPNLLFLLGLEIGIWLLRMNLMDSAEVARERVWEFGFMVIFHQVIFKHVISLMFFTMGIKSFSVMFLTMGIKFLVKKMNVGANITKSLLGFLLCGCLR
ncbi:uncharacterized protein HKW66_Vig0003430 [Vigna angularis]|uniref:Uncharacterized protein n=1 Tax=Phaseolus angularis TaxID=3914 RepID=A0A8T0LG26_PHAAN|nr:uncharacterized protein HKW66_Vig0003430 [Vigna angularis]